MGKKYYIDESGNKKYYIGTVINDYTTNEKYGLLTVQEKEEKEIKLEYHKEIPEVKGWSSYFTYVNENNEEAIYTDSLDNIRKNYDGSYYITKINKLSFNLSYHPAIEAKESYFSYMDNGKEYIYDGNTFYDKFTNSYYFYK